MSTTGNRPRPALDAFAGSLAGLLSSMSVYPLEMAKGRLQAQRTSGGAAKYRGPFGTIATVAREEGLKSLFSGAGVTVMGVTPAWAVYFSSYNALKRKLATVPGLEGGSLLHLAACTGAGAATSFTSNPFWVVKNRLLTQQRTSGEAKYKGALHCGYTVAKEEGVTALWRGFGASLLGVTHVMVQFPAYEKAKSMLAVREGVPVSKLSAKNLILASAASKVVASVITYPHETIRMRMQIDRTGQYRGLADAARKIVNNEGFSALYKGHGTNLVRVVPACVITFTSYELIRRNLHTIAGKKDDFVAKLKEYAHQRRSDRDEEDGQ